MNPEDICRNCGVCEINKDENYRGFKLGKNGGFYLTTHNGKMSLMHYKCENWCEYELELDMLTSGRFTEDRFKYKSELEVMGGSMLKSFAAKKMRSKPSK